MGLWSLIDTLLDGVNSLINWRFYLCFCGGILLGLFAAQVSPEPQKWIAGGICALAGLVIGWRWDRSH